MALVTSFVLTWWDRLGAGAWNLSTMSNYIRSKWKVSIGTCGAGFLYRGLFFVIVFSYWVISYIFIVYLSYLRDSECISKPFQAPWLWE